MPCLIASFFFYFVAVFFPDELKMLDKVSVVSFLQQDNLFNDVTFSILAVNS